MLTQKFPWMVKNWIQMSYRKENVGKGDQFIFGWLRINLYVHLYCLNLIWNTFSCVPLWTVESRLAYLFLIKGDDIYMYNWNQLLATGYKTSLLSSPWPLLLELDPWPDAHSTFMSIWHNQGQCMHPYPVWMWIQPG